MSSRDQHPIEAIHALVDGRLDASEREQVERHVEACAPCRAERDMAEGVRRIVHGAVPDPELPAGLTTRVTEALDDLDRSRSESRAPRTRGWLVPVAAAVVVVAAVVVLWQTGRRAVPIGERIVAAVSTDFGGVKEGALPLELADASPAEVEAYFARSGIEFETRVFDLGMMGYRIAGGRVQDLAGRPSALFAYRGEDGVLMVCRMYLGRLEELTAPSRTIEHDGIEFQVYERDGRTLVFWQEGEVVCVLASDAPAQVVIDLSFAKAVKV